MRLAAEYVFGYGSLAAGAGARGDVTPTRERDPRGFVADLPGFARGWGVAMDNAVDEPGYKWYADPDGARPALFVCFLDIAPVPDVGARVNGVCRPVDATGLAELDARERNYVRTDVSAAVDCGARVWTYVGSGAGRDRRAAGAAAGTAVIDAAYLTAVSTGFRALGPAEWAACVGSLDPDGLPVRELVRHELPG